MDNRGAIKIVNWLIMAMLGPVLFYAKGNWYGMLFPVLCLSMITGCSLRYGRHWEGPVYNVIQLIWISILLSQFLRCSAACWPTGENSHPVIPLTLLFLAFLSAMKGDSATANGIGVLFWVAISLLGITVIAGLWNIKPENLCRKERTVDGSALLVLMLPGIAGFFNEKKNIAGISLLHAAVIIFSFLWIAGILSPGIAAELDWPFYEAAKTVKLFNVAKRFEALVSTGITLCNYALYSLFICSAGNIGEKFDKRKEAIVGCVTISVGLLLLGLSIKPEISAIVCFVYWAICPLIGAVNKNGIE